MRGAWLGVLVLIAACRSSEPCVWPAAVSVAPNADDDDGDGRIDGVQAVPPPGDDELLSVALGTCVQAPRIEGAPKGEVRLWWWEGTKWIAGSEAPPPGARRLGIEVVRGRSASWNGTAKIVADGVPGALEFTAAPIVLRQPSAPVGEVWVADATGLPQALRAALPDEVKVQSLSVDSAGADRWVQDAFQAASADGHRVVVRLPRTGSTRGLRALTPGRGLPGSVGAITVGEGGDVRFDFGGNIEVLAPHSGFPNGRVLLGDGVSTSVLEWLDAQAVQTPALPIETAWLVSGHVDEVVMPLPSLPGIVRVVLASPRDAAEFVPAEQRPFLLECQTKMDRIEAMLRVAVPPGKLAVVKVPTWFIPRVDDGLAVTAIPNPVNALVVGDRYVFGAYAGKDPSGIRLQAEVTRRVRQAGFTPVAVSVEGLAEHGGGVHCAVESM